MANEYKLSYTAQEIDERLNKAGSPDWNDMINKPFGEISTNKAVVFDQEMYITKGKHIYSNDEYCVLNEGILLSNQATYTVIINNEKYENVKFRPYFPYSDFKFFALGNLAVVDLGYRELSESQQTDTGENWGIAIDRYGEINFYFKDNSQLIDSKAHIVIEASLNTKLPIITSSIEYEGSFQIEQEIMTNEYPYEFYSNVIIWPGNNVPVKIEVGDKIYEGFSHGVIDVNYEEVFYYLGNIGLHPMYESEVKNYFPNAIPSHENFLVVWEISSGRLQLGGIFEDLSDGNYEISMEFDNSYTQILYMDNKYLNITLPDTPPAGITENADGDEEDEPIALGKTSVAAYSGIAIGANATSRGDFEDGGGIAIGVNSYSEESTAIGHDAIAINNGIAIAGGYYDYDNQGVGSDNERELEYHIENDIMKLSFYSYESWFEIFKEYQERADEILVRISTEYLTPEGMAEYSEEKWDTWCYENRNYLISKLEIGNVEVDYNAQKISINYLENIDFEYLLSNGRITLVWNFCDEGVLIGNGYAHRGIGINGSAYRTSGVAINGISYGRSSLAINGVSGGGEEDSNYKSSVAIAGSAYNNGSVGIRGTSVPYHAISIGSCLLEGNYSKAFEPNTFSYSDFIGDSYYRKLTQIEYIENEFALNGTFEIEPTNLDTTYFYGRFNSGVATIYKYIGNQAQPSHDRNYNSYKQIGELSYSTSEFNKNYTDLYNRPLKLSLKNGIDYCQLLNEEDVYTISGSSGDDLLNPKWLNCYFYIGLKNLDLQISSNINKGFVTSVEGYETIEGRKIKVVEVGENKDYIKLKFASKFHLCIPENISLHDQYNLTYAFYLANNIGEYTTHLGVNTVAYKDYQTVMGKYNTPDENALFIIGNGKNNSNRSNALTISEDGLITAKGLDLIREDGSIVNLEKYISDIVQQAIQEALGATAE